MGCDSTCFWNNPGVGWLCPVLSSALSVWMEQCASTASLLASVREQERQFEMLSRALEEERRSCAGTLPRPLPNMQVTPDKTPSHLSPPPASLMHISHQSILQTRPSSLWVHPKSSPPSPPTPSVWTDCTAAQTKPYRARMYLLCGLNSNKATSTRLEKLKIISGCFHSY